MSKTFSHSSCRIIFVSFVRTWAQLATDPQCPSLDCCNIASHSLETCSFAPPWTLAYCCAAGTAAADCYRWGEDAPGGDIAVHSALSGFQCRHVCQAHKDCIYWTYLVNVPSLQKWRAKCYLKGPGALQRRVHSHAYVVSGERLCHHFAEGQSLSLAAARKGIQLQIPWRTVTGTNVLTSGQDLLRFAGSSNWAHEAAETFSVLGFVAILDVLPRDKAQELREASAKIADAMLNLDPARLGNRGPRRYSFGGASRYMHIMHVRPWSQLLDNAPIATILKAIFPGGYLAAGGGGDFVLGDTDTYQSLHVDLGGGSFHKFPRPPAVSVNFVVEDLFCAGGPLRMVPGSQWSEEPPPPLSSEPQDAKDAVLCPLPAGSAIVRDLRVWHGGTPNALASTRYLPNAEFVDAEWGPRTCGKGGYLDPCSPVLPSSAHAQLSPEGRVIARGIMDTSGSLQHIDSSATSSWLNDDFAQISRHHEEAY